MLPITTAPSGTLLPNVTDGGVVLGGGRGEGEGLLWGGEPIEVTVSWRVFTRPSSWSNSSAQESEFERRFFVSSREEVSTTAIVTL